MTTRILIAEDDASLAESIAHFLAAAGFVVSTERRGDRARDRIRVEHPDLVVLDLGLPGLDGLSVCRSVRPHFHGPILVLTANGEEAMQIAGLDDGADDYLVKPIKPRLLLARVQALLRRRTPTSTDRVQLGHVVIDAGTREVTVNGEAVVLTGGDYALLWALGSNAGRILSRAELLVALRGVEYDGIDRSVDLRVSRLRRKIGDDPDAPRFIKTVRGVGYIYVKDHA